MKIKKQILRFFSISLCSFLGVLLCFALSSKTFAQPVEPGSYYRLSNLLLQDGRTLDIDSTTNELVMGIKTDKPSQYWKFSPSGGGYYRITNVSLGDEQALDTQPDDNSDGVSELQMGRKGDASGQFWQLVPVSGGYVRLTNQYLDKSSLTTLDDAPANASVGPPFNSPYMAITQRASSAQTWKLTKVTPSTSTTTTPATTTTTPATTTTTPATTTTTPATTTTTPATTTTTPATTTTTPATATTTPATATQQLPQQRQQRLQQRQQLPQQRQQVVLPPQLALPVPRLQRQQQLPCNPNLLTYLMGIILTPTASS
jgi:hypothetical protein